MVTNAIAVNYNLINGPLLQHQESHIPKLVKGHEVTNYMQVKHAVSHKFIDGVGWRWHRVVTLSESRELMQQQKTKLAKPCPGFLFARGIGLDTSRS